MREIGIRESRPGDVSEIEALYGAAFPDEDLVPLVRDLLAEAAPTLSLVAEMDAAIVGHVVLTRCELARTDETAALLGPLAVAPSRQRRGIGSELVRSGLRRMERAGLRHVFVLGDPAWYDRLGFVSEKAVVPPYPLPAAWREAWQSQHLGGAEPPPPGKLGVPEPWRRQALWAP